MAVLGEDFTRSVARALGVTDEDRAEWDSMEEAKLKRMEKQGVSKRAELAKPGIEYGDKVVDSLSATVPFPARLARPDEFAQLVLMLAEHDYLNGETIRMDGALRMAPR